MNLIIFYDHSKDILNIVNKYKNEYNASVYEIKTNELVTLKDKIASSYFNKPINVFRCNHNLLNYENIILISPLWFNKIPGPVIKFLEEQTGKINNIIYLLYNYNKKDQPQEFNKLDQILNLRREKSYFINLNKKEIHVRVYQ